MIRIAAKKFTPQERQQWAAARKEEVAALCTRLEEGISSLRSTDRYRQYLTTMSRFHEYSYRNTMLIMEQLPSASLVASFTAWKKLGRHVKKGEHGIRILAPVTYGTRSNLPSKDSAIDAVHGADSAASVHEDRGVRVVGFKAVSVFDISQTEGKELPDVVHELTGDVDGYDRLFDAIVQAAGVRVAVGPVESSACGMCDTRLGIVTLREGMSEQQNIKTLLHEVAHCRLHPPGNALPRSLREVQAESVAFVVSAHFGLDTSEYSLGYVDGWGSEGGNPELRASLDTISRHASTLITQIEHELERDRERTPEADIGTQKKTAPKRNAPGMDR